MTVRISRVYSGFLEQIKIPLPLAASLRRADDFIRLAVVAVNRVLEEGGAAAGDEEGTGGLFLGTAFGPMETNFDVLSQVIDQESPSPILFSHSVFNAAAGYLASINGITGSALTITDFAFPFFRALELGWLTISAGRLKQCLVLQVETYSELLQDAIKQANPSGRRWHPGVNCWLLERQDESGSGYLIEDLHVESNANISESYLRFSERLVVNGTARQSDCPLSSAVLLGTEMKNPGAHQRLNCLIEADYGSVTLNLSEN